MWYIACLIRGMPIDEAIRQMRFVAKKGATYILETLLEAQEKAVKEHNVEFKSNLWVGKCIHWEWINEIFHKNGCLIQYFSLFWPAESFVGKGFVIKGIRRHAKMRMGVVHYKYCHYFVRLEEGTPPKDYYKTIVTPEEQLNNWLEQKRKRKIYNSL